MNALTLDTSGLVVGDHDEYWSAGIAWSDLDPFTQGYVEALFASARPGYDDASLGGHYVCGFSDLSREALEMIRADCAAVRKLEWLNYGNTVHDGRLFWEERQKPDLGPHNSTFPPQTITIADDGKVHLSTIERAEAGR